MNVIPLYCMGKRKTSSCIRVCKTIRSVFQVCFPALTQVRIIPHFSLSIHYYRTPRLKGGCRTHPRNNFEQILMFCLTAVPYASLSQYRVQISALKHCTNLRFSGHAIACTKWTEHPLPRCEPCQQTKGDRPKSAKESRRLCFLQRFVQKTCLLASL